MYYPVKDGSEELIQEYACQLPPVGYGKNRLTGELEYIGTVKSSQKASEQKWKRIELPRDWDKRRALEQKMQETDPEYYDPNLEKVREQHWQYRLCGVWIWVNGKCVYLTGQYYFYLNWCQLDIGHPYYRDTDRKFYYVWEYCCEDPRCAGLADIERRRMGKTYKSGSILLDRTSLSKNHHAGIQSKTSPDAKQIFQKTVVSFFKKIPDFFRPVYDTSKGITPTTEMRFFQTSRRGRFADSQIGTKELESWIDFGSSETFYYDGAKLNSYVMDEFGKSLECNVWDRWNVVRFCMDQDGDWIGKALLTTTIEEMENGGENGKKIWDNSDPGDRNANGRTKSGLYRFFLPAYETTFFDEYGMPQTEKAKTHYLNERAGLANDPRSLSSQIRKNPFTITEAFRIDGNRCLFDAMKLNLQLDSISWKQNLTETGVFEWENGVAFSKVVWRKRANGRFRIAWLFENDEEANRVVKRHEKYYPNNYFNFCIGCDPFKYDAVKDERRSDCAAYVIKRANLLRPEDPYNDCFVVEYKYRAQTTGQQYEDLLKMAWYFGCQILFERNVDNWKDWFFSRNCEGFLMKLPGEDEFGIYSDGAKTVHQLLCDYTETYINGYVERVYFPNLLTDWLEFDIGKTAAYDCTMAAGYTLIALREKLYKNRELDIVRDISEYFIQHKAI